MCNNKHILTTQICTLFATLALLCAFFFPSLAYDDEIFELLLLRSYQAFKNKSNHLDMQSVHTLIFTRRFRSGPRNISTTLDTPSAQPNPDPSSQEEGYDVCDDEGVHDLLGEEGLLFATLVFDILFETDL